MNTYHFTYSYNDEVAAISVEAEDFTKAVQKILAMCRVICDNKPYALLHDVPKDRT